MSAFRRSRVPIESFAMLHVEPDLDDDDKPPDIYRVLDLCPPTGRTLLRLRAVDGMTAVQAADFVHLPLAIANQAFDATCLIVAAEYRRLGWDEARLLAARG